MSDRTCFASMWLLEIGDELTLSVVWFVLLRLCHGDPRCQPALATRRKSSWSDVIGLCQPPAGETLCSTSLGPQAPFSYSKTGVPAFSTGSTIRQASST